MAFYTQIHIYSKCSLLMACQSLCSLVWDLWRGFWIFPVDPTPLGHHISFTRRERECHTEATGKGVLGKQRSQGQQWEGGSKSERTEPRLRSTLTTSRGRHHPGVLVVSKGNNSKGRWVKQRDSYPEDAALLCQEHWLPRQFGGRTGTTSPLEMGENRWKHSWEVWFTFQGLWLWVWTGESCLCKAGLRFPAAAVPGCPKKLGHCRSGHLILFRLWTATHVWIMKST